MGTLVSYIIARTSYIRRNVDDGRFELDHNA